MMFVKNETVCPPSQTITCAMQTGIFRELEPMVHFTGRIVLLTCLGTGAVLAQPARPSPQDGHATPAKAEDFEKSEGSGKKVPEAKPGRPAGSSGVVVFVDPATGNIVEPSAEQIQTLTGASQPPVGSKAPLMMIQGPGTTVGIVMPPESYSYAIATVGPEGKLTLDCVTGEKTAADRVAPGVSGDKPSAAKGSRDEKR
jgi:hypothetical protein